MGKKVNVPRESRKLCSYLECLIITYQEAEWRSGSVLGP